DILAGDHRTAEERARDAHRHPKETLLFFGVEPQMSVVEIWPGGGWYTQVIAPYLKSGGGVYYAAGFPRAGASERVIESLDAFKRNYVDQPDIYGNVVMTVLGETIAPDGPADVVLTFRNVHNWASREVAEQYFRSFYAALKPGGILGVVEHRADGANLPRDGSSGYMYTDDVIALAEAAGFKLEAASEINANPLDTKDHPFGVWTLPPVRRSSTVRGMEEANFDRAAYDAIGESDRMTLKFRKPETDA
ncbi:MAG: class I SAM-dependent methyltransferase, partial [Hyphococcus sp.]